MSRAPLKPADAPDSGMSSELEGINTKLKDMAGYISDPHVKGLLTALGAGGGLGAVGAATGSYLVDNLIKANAELRDMRFQARDFQHLMGGAGATGLGGHVGTGQIMGQAKTMEMMLGISQKETMSFAADAMRRGLTSDWETAVGAPGRESEGMMFQTRALSKGTGMATPEIMGLYDNLRNLYGITGTDLPDAFATLNISAINAGQSITEFTSNFVGLSKQTKFLGVSFDENVALVTRFGKRLEEGSMSLQSLARLAGAGIGGGGLGAGVGILSMVGENIGAGGSAFLQERLGGLSGVHRGMALEQMLKGEGYSLEERGEAVGATVETVRGLAAGAAGLTGDQGRMILEAQGKFENLDPESGIGKGQFYEFRHFFSQMLKDQGISAEKTYEANEEWALVAEDMKDTEVLYRDAVIGHREASEAMLVAAKKLGEGEWEDALAEMVDEYRDSLPIWTKMGQVLDQLFIMGMMELDKMVFLLEELVLGKAGGITAMLTGEGGDPMDAYYESERGRAMTEMGFTMAASFAGTAATMAKSGQMDPGLGIIAKAWGARTTEGSGFGREVAEEYMKVSDRESRIAYMRDLEIIDSNLNERVNNLKKAQKGEYDPDMGPQPEEKAIGGYIMGRYPGQPKRITAHVGEYINTPGEAAGGGKTYLLPITLNYNGPGTREDAEDMTEFVWNVVSDKLKEFENSNEAGSVI